MDENNSDDEQMDKQGDGPDKVKRMRPNEYDVEDCSISSATNPEDIADEQSASTSTSIDSGLPISVPIDESYLENENRNGDGGGEGENNGSDGENEFDTTMSSLDFSDDTIINSTDPEDSADEEADEVLKKEKPKHNWHLVSELTNRQLGLTKKQTIHPSLFEQRCYGSLRNVEKLELMYKLEEHHGCVNCLNYSPDGTYLASGSDDLNVMLWDWSIGKKLLKIKTEHKRNIFQTKFLDLKGSDLHLATAARDGQIYYIQVGTDGVRDNRKIGQHKGACHKLTTLKDRPNVILSAGEDGAVLFHDLRKTKPERIIVVENDNGGPVTLFSVHSNPINSNQFCVGGKDRYIKIYDHRKASKFVSKFYPSSREEKSPECYHVTCAVYNHDGSEIIGSYTDAVYLFETDKPAGQYAHKYSGHRNGATIKGVSYFGPHSEFIMSGSDCGHLFVWEKQTESIVQFLLADDNGVVNCLEPHPRVPFLATSGLDWDVKIWAPSFEGEAEMKGLATTVRNNKKNGWSPDTETSENTILWMLWRRLRATRSAEGASGFSLLDFDSSGSDTSEGTWLSGDDIADEPPDCTTS